MKIPGRLFFLLLWVFLFSENSIAQVYREHFYPADSGAARYFHNRLNFESPLQLTDFDTTLKDFQAYNWIDQRIPFNAHLGNSGLAFRNLSFSNERESGFYYGPDFFEAYLFHQNEIKYYLNHNPFTELGFVTGASKEQVFHARHQQRVFKKLALGVDFEHINSLGTYQRQKSNNRRVVFKAQFFSENLRYGLIANYHNSKVVVQENGGIVYDSVYEQNLEPDRSIIAVRLNSAQNVIRKSGIYLQQYYQLSGRKTESKSDTASLSAERIKLRFGRLSHSLDYDRNSFTYTDPSPISGYYSNIWIDSTATFDSVYFEKLENIFSWSNADYPDRYKPQTLLLMFGLKHQLSKVKDSADSDSFNHLLPFGELCFNPHPLLTVEGKASFVLSDDAYRGDFNLSGLAQLKILRKHPFQTTLNFALQSENQSAPYFYQHYYSNHFIWDNDFDKTVTNKLSVFITQDRMKLGADVYTISNYLFIDTDTMPAQAGSSVEIFKAYLEKELRLGKFDFSGSVLYQKSSSSDIIRLPEWLACLTTTFNLRLFQGALNTRSGFDLRYNSPYYADAWMPAIRGFYHQNEKEIGGFIQADVFVNFKVKRTRFFFKLQNVLSLLGDSYDFYAVPHYPLQDFGLKFGLDWRFHD
ncbi:MAG TPA: hypothetical protein PK915_00715 [Bacteroidales bacterium]|nr:hypothetical protein [Bacteroidales bacterium]